MTNSPVTLNISDNGIATVSLNKPEKLNALDIEMFLAIKNTIKSLRKNRQIRVVILTGVGPDFCTGLDVKSVMSKPSSALKLLFKWLPGNSNLAQKVTSMWRELNVPVIAAIHGRCWGGGLQIALGADFRIAQLNSSLSIMESKWGLIPDMAGNTQIRKLMPIDVAMKLTMTAETLTADQALQYNLVTEVHDSALDRANELALKLIEKSPDVLAGVKKLFNQNWSRSDRTFFAKESWYQVKILAGKNQKIATRKALGKEAEYKARMHW
ncbi:enoyl-CoA hydratase [Psychrosphaera saromensis]|uniref:Enoyl-CoA hydratase n=1 Tax=Psychrosphaera saromensis TaxID=716813 RepID=A0A2S7UZA0_9GAMM|nr:crotonase/enoyl-CoA hydratase family protein [Psychrosphaera saromensis]PQJ55109.1 enoyl-CoA hydratase [Psychrosphaera saromensis]GHB73911.1 enoyl-CoA hydratase [Psychrosphaera saromensis]GLQ13365.1 enoyl-CoA hydratase [Psychrosphaera saromensis]